MKLAIYDQLNGEELYHLFIIGDEISTTSLADMRQSGAGRGMLALRSKQDPGEGDSAWLRGLEHVDLPPLDTLLQQCLIQPIQDQVQL